MVEIGEQPSGERRGDCDHPVAMCRVTIERWGAVPALSGPLYIMREAFLIMRDFPYRSSLNALLQTAVHGFLSPRGVGIKFAA